MPTASPSGGTDRGRSQISATALAVALALALAFLALRPITSPDVWWHLSMGQATAEAGSPIYEDPVAAPSGSRYVNVVWLFDLPLYGLYRAGGLVAVNLAVAALAALSFLLCWAVARDALGGDALGGDATGRNTTRGAPWTALAVATLAAGGAHLRFAPRPQALLLTLLPLTIWLAHRGARADGRAAWVYRGALLATVAFWAQVHSSVVIAPVVAIAASLSWCWPRRSDAGEQGRGDRALSIGTLITLGLTALLPMTGPSGVDLIRRVLAHQDNYVIRYITEMRPLSLDLWLSAETDIVLVKILLLITLLGLLRHPKFEPGPVLLALLGGYLALGTNRFAAAWCILLIPLAAGAVRPTEPGVEGWRRRAASVAAAVGVVALLAWRSEAPSFETGLQFEPGPPLAVTALGLQGTVFNSYEQGGFLGWRLYGRPRVIIDSRSTMRFDLEEIYGALQAVHHLNVFRALDRLHGFSAALVPPGTELCRDLVADPAWRPVWRSALTTIFVPQKDHQALKLSALEPCGAIFPVAGCGAASRVSAALDEVDSLLRITPDDPELSRLGARLSLQCTTPPMLGRAAAFLEGAGAELEHRDYARFQALLALGQGQTEEALRLLEESPPDHGEAQILRLQILRHLDRPREALPLAQDLVIRAEASGLPRLRELLAWACRETGDQECFIRETLRSALSGNPAARAQLEEELQKGSLPSALQDLAAAAVDRE